MATEVFEQPPPDPGTRTSRLVALVLALLMGGLLILVQNADPVASIFEPGATLEEHAEAAASDIAPPDIADPFNMTAKFAVQIEHTHPEFADDPTETMLALDRFARTAESRVRAAVVAAEISGPEQAVDRLGTLAEALDGTALEEDAADLLTIYTDGPGGLSEDAADRLVEHHGYFGELALTYGMDNDDPARAPLVTLDSSLVLLLAGVGLGAMLVGVAGLVLFVVAVVLVVRRKVRSGMGPVEPGGSVFLETFVLFAVGFLLLKVGVGVLAGVVQDETWLVVIQLLGQWMLLASPLWPLLRGMGWHRFRRAIGWHRGKGVLREMGAGVLAYLAGLPILVAGFFIALLMLTIVTLFRMSAGLGEPPPPQTGVFELASSDNAVILVAVFLLATVWAPLCEESIFRGALYRHLRGRGGIVVCVIASALVFGLCHAYGPVLVWPVVMLGATFALMREWRGSLIAPMTAHAMHNGTVMILLLTVMRMMG